ncbi:hypothetical protein INR49_005402 [Caranx melampygus]|nr:hypothetical protein INR49_005402 [Caranx melampygus]
MFRSVSPVTQWQWQALEEVKNAAGLSGFMRLHQNVCERLCVETAAHFRRGKKTLLPTLDIYAWTEEHVYFWMQQIFSAGEGTCDMQRYADLFKENHITGKRLLLLTENDMRDMGVKSKGHGEIERLTNDYLGFLHFPPLFKVPCQPCFYKLEGFLH